MQASEAPETQAEQAEPAEPKPESPDEQLQDQEMETSVDKPDLPPSAATATTSEVPEPAPESLPSSASAQPQDMESPEPSKPAVNEPVAAGGVENLELVPEESRPMPVQDPPKAFPILAPPMPAPKGLGFGLLPPPPPPSSSVVGGSNLRFSTEEAVIVVDPLDITAADRLCGPVAREESRAAEEEESDDACLLGMDAPDGKDQPRRIADDGIDSASDQEDAGAQPSSRTAQAEAPNRAADDAGAAVSSAFPTLAPPRPLHPGRKESEDTFEVRRQESNSVPFTDPVPAIEKPPPPTHAFGHEPSPGMAGDASERLALPVGASSFMVKVPEPYPGLQYRKSKDLQERLPRYAKHNSIVHGFVEESWLRVGDGHFLPMQVKNIWVLEPVPPESADVLPPLSLPHSPGQLAGHTADTAGRSSSSTTIRPAADDDGASGEEAVPDEGPRDVPRPSYHRMLQPMGPSGADGTGMPSTLKPSGSATGLPGRSVSLAGLPSPQGDLAEPVAEAQSAASPASASRGSPWPTPAPREALPARSADGMQKQPSKAARSVSADAHEFAALDLLQRVVDPFGDAEFDERPSLRARGKTTGSVERRQQAHTPKRSQPSASLGSMAGTPSAMPPNSSTPASNDNQSAPKLGYPNGNAKPRLQPSASTGRLLQL